MTSCRGGSEIGWTRCQYSHESRAFGQRPRGSDAQLSIELLQFATELACFGFELFAQFGELIAQDIDFFAQLGCFLILAGLGLVLSRGRCWSRTGYVSRGIAELGA